MNTKRSYLVFARSNGEQYFCIVTDLCRHKTYSKVLTLAQVVSDGLSYNNKLQSVLFCLVSIANFFSFIAQVIVEIK